VGDSPRSSLPVKTLPESKLACCSWYGTEGRDIESGATTFLKIPFRSLLGYAYKVNGRPYWGLFALIAEDRETAEKLQKQAEGRPVTVRYNPKSPEVSFLEDRELLGRRVVQDPMYLDNS
jgi:hypothetical protein